MARLPSGEAEAFARTTLLPALEKIEAALPGGSPFTRLIRATRTCAAAPAAAGG
jgi:hypothetical protein